MKPNVKKNLIYILIFILILLILGVVLYDYVPLNQVIPTISKYEATEEVKEQLKEIATEDTSDIVLTYEITESDLGVYENTKNYDKGKANPFSSYATSASSTESTGTTSSGSGQSSEGQTNSNNQSNSQNNTSNIDSSSNKTNTFYEDSGTK